jgi:hypothetical protein
VIVRSAKIVVAAGMAALAAALWSMHVRADPQASTGVTLGYVETGLRTSASAAFHFGARTDVLFLRHRETDAAFGPYADVATAGFHTLQAGGGVEWLLPVLDGFPLVLSAGGFGGKTDLGWEPGVVAGVFFGSRSYNFHSWYGLATGLFAQGRYGLGDAHEGDIVVGVQLDLELVALPFVFAYEAITH